MAQIPQAPTAFSPPSYTDAASTSPTSFLPPSKRQRISPNPTSPLGLSPPPPSTVQLATSPLAQTPLNGASSMPSHGAGAMGPPSRPSEKATTADELTDVLAQSGIDIRDEERNLTDFFTHTAAQTNGSFGSNISGASTDHSLSAGNSFNDGSGAALVGQPPFRASHPAGPARHIEQIAKEQWQATRQREQLARSLHLNNAFLQTNPLWLRMRKKTYANGITMPKDGIIEPPLQPPANRITTSSMTGADGTSITAVKAKYRLAGEVPLAEILTIMSLASAERVRSLVEDAASLAKGRISGAHGQITAEWSDVAAADNPQQAATTSTSENRPGWESAVSPMSTNPLKRSHSSANRLPPTPTNTSKPAQAGFTLPNEFARCLRTTSTQERSIEEGRKAKRARRAAGAGSSDGSKPGSAGPSTPGSTGPGSTIIGDRAPETADTTSSPSVSTKKLTKKEAAKQRDARIDEAHQHKSANSTAAMMLGGKGGLFGKKKAGGYSWMTGGGKPGGMSGSGTPGKPGGGGSGAGGKGGSGVGGGAEGAGGAAGAAGLTDLGGRRFGEWREDRVRGAGIQMRDWVGAVEADGKGTRSLASSLVRMK
ncbi:MAG: hypothetical protein M1825_005757 [Sarcosagium campestre]|nr:MAG: hypothetical protein M1825_005757 [Sarcosagium campestre]